MDNLRTEGLAASKGAPLQKRSDPALTDCACGWEGLKHRLIPHQASSDRLCPACLTEIMTA